MTGFDLPQNFPSDPESLLRRTRARLISSWRPLSQPNHSLHRCQLLKLWPRRHSVITLLRLLTRSLPGPRLTPEEKILRSRRVLLRWCRPVLFVARPTRMLALISNNSWSSVALLLSREYLRMRSGSVYFRSLF